MSGFSQLSASQFQEVGQRLERLAKNFAAGYHGLESAGRTGVGALVKDSVDDVIRSITLSDSDFFLTKDIPTLKATQPVYMYMVKTAVQSGVDLAGSESFLPQTDAAQYMRVAEVLKVYGIRKNITQMSALVNDAGGYHIDLEKENDENAALAMARAMELDLYHGGDYFLAADGSVDTQIMSNVNGPVRNVRGIQQNVREGNSSQRGIPGDFIGFGNNRSVVFNRAGAALDRPFLDKMMTAVRDNGGLVKEGHCTTSQLAEFRAQFFPFERGDLGAAYAIRGAGVTNDEQVKLPVDTAGGSLDMIPTRFKYRPSRPYAPMITAGAAPSTPSISGTAASATVTGSGFAVGDVYNYKVVAVNMSGKSSASAASSITVGAGDAGKAIDVTIAAPSGAGVEKYEIYRSPVEAAGTAGTEMFLGYCLPAASGATTFRDNGKMVPGLDTILFLPRNKNRAQLPILGQLLNKLQLGVTGLAFETVYASYFGCVVDRPRSFAIADNVMQQREGL